MAEERWCEIKFNRIFNTLIVDPETEQGQDYLSMREAEGAVLMPEAEALALYPPS